MALGQLSKGCHACPCNGPLSPGGRSTHLPAGERVQVCAVSTAGCAGTRRPGNTRLDLANIGECC